MNGFTKYLKKRQDEMAMMGELIQGYRIIYLAVLFLVAALEVGMTVFMSLRLAEKYSVRNVIYLCCYGVLFVASVATAIVLLLSKKKNIKPFVLSVLVYVYVFVLIVWATTISSVDIYKGNYPIVYLTIIMVIGSIVFIDPITYCILGGTSSVVIFVMTLIFQPDNTIGFFFNLLVFIVMSAIVAYRNYNMTLKEERNKKNLERLSEYDVLTGLKNENSYYKLVDSLCEKIKKGSDVHFTITMMDVNLLKATNDKYGHQYGAHLIKTAGQKIGVIFEESHAFHVGGDEFIVVSVSDHKRVPEYIERFDSEMRYAPMTHKGNEIFLSLARGFASYQKGDAYDDVLQRADEAMYAHKKQMKKELGIAER